MASTSGQPETKHQHSTVKAAAATRGPTVQCMVSSDTARSNSKHTGKMVATKLVWMCNDSVGGWVGGQIICFGTFGDQHTHTLKPTWSPRSVGTSTKRLLVRARSCREMQTSTGKESGSTRSCHHAVVPTISQLSRQAGSARRPIRKAPVA